MLVEQNAFAALSIADRGYVLETGSVILSGSAQICWPTKKSRGLSGDLVVHTNAHEVHTLASIRKR